MRVINNPNYQRPAQPGALTTTQRNALKTAVAAAIAAWPADQPQISVNDLVGALHANPPAGITAEQFDGVLIRVHLATLGYQVV
jgi:hypothetical protein